MSQAFSLEDSRSWRLHPGRCQWAGMNQAFGLGIHAMAMNQGFGPGIPGPIGLDNPRNQHYEPGFQPEGLKIMAVARRALPLGWYESGLRPGIPCAGMKQGFARRYESGPSMA